jgi:hypothetical protein
MSLQEEHVRAFTRSCVRAGLLGPDELQAEVAAAIAAELPDHKDDAHDLAATWIALERDEAVREQDGWPEATDYERLQTAFAELEHLDVVVLQGCEDHWAAKAELDRLAAVHRTPLGIAWFTPADVWHAIDEGMLEVNLWHGTTANAAPGDDLLDDVLNVIEKHGLEAHFDEGRIEVAARWEKRVPRE